MTDSEIKFVELYRQKILVEQDKSFPVISELYYLLRNEHIGNCPNCVQRFFSSLASSYIALSKHYVPYTLDEYHPETETLLYKDDELNFKVSGIVEKSTKKTNKKNEIISIPEDNGSSETESK